MVHTLDEVRVKIANIDLQICVTQDELDTLARNIAVVTSDITKADPPFEFLSVSLHMNVLGKKLILLNEQRASLCRIRHLLFDIAETRAGDLHG